MQLGSKLGCYIPLPLQQHYPQCFTSLKKKSLLVLPSAIHEIEKKWICQLHGILHLPCSLFRTVVLPLHLYLSYGSIPEHGDLPVEDAHWIDSELSLGFHLNHIPIYHMVRVIYIFIKKRNMKNIMIPSASRTMQVYMQLALFFQALQTAHNILVTAWHNSQAPRKSSLPTL